MASKPTFNEYIEHPEAESSNVCPLPSSGISRKTSVPDTKPSLSSTSKSTTSSTLKIPDIKQKSGIVPRIEVFVVSKGSPYHRWANGARYPKIAVRVLMTNESSDTDVIGFSQHLYFSATGTHLAKLQALKLGTTYSIYNAGYYRVSEEVAILNWRAPTYADQQNLTVKDDDFLRKFGGQLELKGVIDTVGLASVCNCVRLIFNAENENFVKTHPACNSAGMLLPGENDDQAEVAVDGTSGPLTSLNVTLVDSQVPVHLIVHPTYAKTNEEDLVLEVGQVIKFSASRFLNPSNLCYAFRIASNKNESTVADQNADKVEITEEIKGEQPETISEN